MCAEEVSCWPFKSKIRSFRCASPPRRVPLPSLLDDVQAPLPQLPAGRVYSFLSFRGGIVGVLLLAGGSHPRPHCAAYHCSADDHLPVLRRPVSPSLHSQKPHERAREDEQMYLRSRAACDRSGAADLSEDPLGMQNKHP